MSWKLLSRMSSTSPQPRSLLPSLSQRLRLPATNSLGSGAVAVAIIVAATLAKPLLDKLAGAPVPPYVTFYPAVVIIALCGGPLVGVVAAVVTLIIAWFLFLPVYGSFAVAGTGTTSSLEIYGATSTFLAWIVGQARLTLDDAVAIKSQREYAARESVHRIKNRLAVVQAIVSKVFREVETTEQYRDVLNARLAALNIAQDVLVKREWEDVPIDAVVDSSLAPFLPNPGLTVKRGPPATVPARCVSGLCMALYELSTNAMKYGALAGGRGPVVLTWRIEGRDAVLEGLKRRLRRGPRRGLWSQAYPSRTGK